MKAAISDIGTFITALVMVIALLVWVFIDECLHRKEKL